MMRSQLHAEAFINDSYVLNQTIASSTILCSLKDVKSCCDVLIVSTSRHETHLRSNSSQSEIVPSHLCDVSVYWLNLIDIVTFRRLSVDPVLYFLFQIISHPPKNIFHRVIRVWGETSANSSLSRWLKLSPCIAKYFFKLCLLNLLLWQIIHFIKLFHVSPTIKKCCFDLPPQ